MTTIAWDGFTLATDSQITHSDSVYGHAKKIYELKNGSYFAMCGQLDMYLSLKDWLNGDGEKPVLDEGETFIAIVISPSEIYEIRENFRKSPVSGNWASGSGEIQALMAMKCGKTAIEAVEIACEMDIYSCLPVQSVIMRTNGRR